MWNSSGSVLFTQVFDPYGNPYASVGPDSTSWRFTGEQTDENELIFLRARYYDPFAYLPSECLRQTNIIT
jgi:hypothetical protein